MNIQINHLQARHGRDGTYTHGSCDQTGRFGGVFHSEYSKLPYRVHFNSYSTTKADYIKEYPTVRKAQRALLQHLKGYNV